MPGRFPSIDVRGGGPGVSAESQIAISGLMNSETTYTSGTVNLSVAGGPLTIASASGQRFNFSINTTHPAFAVYDGAQTYSAGSLSLAAANGVTMTLNASTLSISVALTSQSGQALSASNGSFAFQTGAFSNANGVTFGTSAGSIISASINQTPFAIYEGAASITSGTARFTNANGVTFTINGQTISASILQSAPISRWNHNTAALYSSSTSNMVNTSVSLVYIPIAEAVAFSRVDIPVSIDLSTQATTATNAVDISAIGVFYTRNASTLSPIVGQSSTTTYTWASNSGAVSSLTGPRLMSFNIATTLTAGEYWFGMQLSSHSGSSIGASTTIGSMTIAPVHGTSYTVLPWANISQATASTLNTLFPLQGMNSVSIANTTQSHQASQITMYGATAQVANLVVILRNV